MSTDLRRAAERLTPGDPALLLIQLAAETDDPAVVYAVVRKLLAMVREERRGLPEAGLCR